MEDRNANSPGQDAASTASPATSSPPRWARPTANAEQAAHIRKTIIALPLLVLLAALFFQNWGQYAGTRSYVNWMDALSASVGSVGEMEEKPPSLANEQQLHVSKIRDEQRVEAVLGGAPPLGEEPEKDSSFSMGFLGLLLCLMQLAWLAWVVLNRDVRLWAHTLLTVSVMAALKGLLSYATVVPDAAGWSSCQQRLGEDGLSYFRQDTFFLQAVFDVMCLEIRLFWGDLWQSGSAARGLYCTSGFISTPTYIATIFSLAICDFTCVATRLLPGMERRSWLVILWTILVIIVLLSMIVPVSSRCHYVADVLISVFLGTLIYGNPAVAILADRISLGGSGDLSAFFSLLHSPHVPTGPVALAQDLLGMFRGLDAEMSQAPQDEEEYTAIDVGQVFALPCAPWHWEPTYYLRSQPGRLARAQHDGSYDTYLQEQIAHFKAMEEQHVQLREKKEKELESAREQRRIRAAEALKVKEWNHKSELASEKNKLEKEHNAALEDVRQQLVAEEERFKALSETIDENKKRYSLKETERNRLEASLSQVHEDSLEVERSCQQRQAEIEELQMKVVAEIARRAVQGILEVAQGNLSKNVS